MKVAHYLSHGPNTGSNSRRGGIKKQTNHCNLLNCSQVGWPSEGKLPKILVQYNVCHSKSLANTFYSSHSLHGLALASTATSGPRPSNFKEGQGFYGVTSHSTDYSLRSQELTFTRLLGPRHQQQNYLENSYVELAQRYPQQGGGAPPRAQV